MNAAKHDIRARMRRRRLALTPRARSRASAALGRRILCIPGLTTGANVAIYWPTPSEISPLGVLVRPDINWYLPIIPRRGRRMRFAPLSAARMLRRNHRSILEPQVPPFLLRSAQNMQFVIAPLLAFDRQGHRLGMGGSYYDATLSFLRGHRSARPTLFGAAYAFQEVTRMPVEPWDVPLDGVVTDRELIRCVSTNTRV